jgi:hypothetical protein
MPVANNHEDLNLLNSQEHKHEANPLMMPSNNHSNSIIVEDAGKTWSGSTNIDRPMKETTDVINEENQECNMQHHPKYVDEDGPYELKQDVFSMIFISQIKSVAFLYSCFIVLVQIVILVLCLIGLFKNRQEGNLLQIPVHNAMSEIVAQALALLVTVLVAGDIINALDVFDVKFSENVQTLFDVPHASELKWYLANVLRFIVGSLGVIVAFFFICQGIDVLDLFLDFAVVQFVSELDEIGFYLADTGILASQLQRDAENVKKVRMDYKTDASSQKKQSLSSIKLYAYILFMPWIVIKIKQHSGLYFQAECQQFQIWFEPNSYNFFRSKCPLLKGTERECPEKWESDLGVAANGLQYQAFNDIYYAAVDDDGGLIFENHRPVYYQRSTKNTDFRLTSEGEIDEFPGPPGKISYCKSINAWVFSIKGVAKGIGAQDCSWLMRSPETNKFHLSEVAESDWLVWTGVITETNVDITCLECRPSENVIVGCNYHGTCSSEEICSCQDDWLGYRCETCTACKALEIVGSPGAKRNFTKTIIHESTIDNDSNGFDSPNNDLDGLEFSILNHNGTDMEVYDRPVFYINLKSKIHKSGEHFVLLFYTGSKYTIRIVHKSYDQCISYLESFHSLWDFDIDVAPLYETEVTREQSAMGQRWVNSTSNDIVEFHFRCKNQTDQAKCGFFEID